MLTENLSRRDVLKTLAIAAAGAALPSTSNADDAKPNILFIAVDDLRPNLNCYGESHIHSPNIDGLAADGVLFERTFCQVPVCGASRASLLTGVRPKRDRFVGFDTWADQDLPGAMHLPKYLKQNGYHTVSNGKIYHHLRDAEGSWSEPAWRPRGDWGARGYLDEKNKTIAAENNGRGPSHEAMDVDDSEYPDGRIAEKTIKDLQRLKTTNQPFFLAAGFMKPHLPFNAPKKYWDLYKRDEINLADNPFRPKDAPDASIHNSGELRQYSDIPQRGEISDDLARTLVHGYQACVSYTDAMIGKVLAELDRLDLRKNTIVILWGDHGWNLGEHTLWCKHCNYQTSLRAPLLISAPGFKGGVRTDALTEFVDIYPSLCELAGLPVPAHAEGTSFVPLMTDPDRLWKKAIFSRYNNGDSIRTERYLYTEWKNNSGETYARMLYDHFNDPNENINLAALPEYRMQVESLSRWLESGWKEAAPLGIH